MSQRSMQSIQDEIDDGCRSGDGPTDREAILAWLLENAMSALVKLDPQSMGTCWLAAQADQVLERNDWHSFQWRYNGS